MRRRTPDMATAELKPQPTLCHGLVEAIAASLRTRAAARGVEIVVARIAEDVVARTDRRALGTILMSLIGGAIDCAPLGKVHVRVSRISEAGARSVEISISEIAAPGAAPAAQRRRGSLPLTSARELAERLGGQLSVQSAAAEGSTYVLEIPEG